MARLAHQYGVAGREQIDESGLLGSRAGCGIDDDRTSAAKDRLHALEGTPPKLLEIGTAMVDDWHIHCTQDAIGDWRWPRDLEEMAPRPARRVAGQAIFLVRWRRKISMLWDGQD